MSRRGPPAALEALLRRLLPPGRISRSIVGDLREEMEIHRARGGRFPRARWALRAAGVVLSYRTPSRTALAALLDETAKGTFRSVRSLLHRPASTLAALLVLAIGTGLATFMFSVVYGIAFRDLDVRDPHELRVVTVVGAQGGGRAVSLDDFLAWREARTPFETLSAYRTGTFNLSGEGQPPERRSGAWLTWEALPALGVEPAFGRGFGALDALPGAERVVLLSDGLWRGRFGGAGDVLGATVRVDGEPATVIGVMPPGFRFPSQHDLWLPLALDGEAVPASGPDHAAPVGSVFGRLRDGAAPEAAALALEEVLRRRPTEAGTAGSPGVRLRTFNEPAPGLALLLGGMMAAALLVLAVACANVSGVLLARAAGRAREVGVRCALGAGRLRAGAPFLTEALVLAVAGSSAGVLLARGGVSLFELALAGTGRPWWMVIAVDGPVLLFVLAVLGLVTVVSGVGPALLALRSGPGAVVPGGGTRGVAGGGRVGRALVVLQVAASCTLLVGTGLVVKSLVNLSRIDFPFAREDVLTARVRAAGAAHPDSLARAAFYDGLLEELRALPGAESVALSGGLPTFSLDETPVRAEGTDAVPEAELPRALRAAGTPGVLRTLGVELIAGRDLLATDVGTSEPVAVVEREMALLLFGRDDPIGRRFREVAAGREGPWRRVVGLVDELHLEGVNALDHGFGYYVPLAQADPSWVAAVVRSSRDPADVANDVRALVAGLDPDLPLYDVMTMREVAASEGWFFRAFGGVFAAFGAAALLMAAVGLYGLLSLSVARRIPEMGVRMALGAGASRVGGLVLKDAFLQVGTGGALGLLLSLLVADGLRVVLFQVEPRDPLVYLGVALTVALVTLLAAAAPTLRAVRLDPTEALREE